MSFISRDTWIGVVMLIVAAVYWLEADKIRISPLDGPVGASGLPKALACALGVLALILIARSLVVAFTRQKTAVTAKTEEQPLAVEVQAPAVEGQPPAAVRPHLRALGLLVIGVGYLLLVPWLGYTVTIAALLLTVALYIGASFNLRTVVIAVTGGVVYYLLFVQFLGIPLPAGKILEPFGLG